MRVHPSRSRSKNDEYSALPYAFQVSNRRTSQSAGTEASSTVRTPTLCPVTAKPGSYDGDRNSLTSASGL